MQMLRAGDGREGTSFQGHWGAIEGFRADVLSWGWFCPPWDTGWCLGTFLVVTIEGCSWHRVGGGQECCSTPGSAQSLPTPKNDLALNVSSAEGERPWFRSGKKQVRFGF